MPATVSMTVAIAFSILGRQSLRGATPGIGPAGRRAISQRFELLQGQRELRQRRAVRFVRRQVLGELQERVLEVVVDHAAVSADGEQDGEVGLAEALGDVLDPGQQRGEVQRASALLADR